MTVPSYVTLCDIHGLRWAVGRRTHVGARLSAPLPLAGSMCAFQSADGIRYPSGESDVLRPPTAYVDVAP